MTHVDPIPTDPAAPDIQPAGPQEPEIQPAETPTEMPPLQQPNDDQPNRM